MKADDKECKERGKQVSRGAGADTNRQMERSSDSKRAGGEENRSRRK